MSELEVRGKREGLVHGDVPPGLEHHHRDGLSGQSVADNELGNDTGRMTSGDSRYKKNSHSLQADLLVRDGLDHADGDDVEEGDDESEDKGPDGHAGRPDFNNDDTEDEHGHLEKRSKGN